MAQTVLITGCSSGIGLESARALQRRGWRVFATCRREDDCRARRDEGLESFPLDYADPGSVEAVMAEIEWIPDEDDGLTDSIFVFDPSVMTPWGTILLRPGKTLRRPEVALHEALYRRLDVPGDRGCDPAGYR